MKFFGIPSYPPQWRRRLWYAVLLLILTAIETFGAMLWILREPSAPESRVFLNYSAERWALVLAPAFFLAVLLVLLGTIRQRRAWVEARLGTLSDTRIAAALLALLTLLLVGLGALLLRFLGNGSAHIYLERALPLLAWSTIVLVQWWFYLAALLRDDLIAFIRGITPEVPGDERLSVKRYSRPMLAALAGIALVYLLLLARSYLDVREAILIGDSWSYLYGAGLNLTDPAFFSERRPWAILLVFKLLGNSPAAIEIFQLGLSGVAWLSLAWTASRMIRNPWISLFCFLVLLAFSLTPAVQVWNHTVLSESLSISLMVLVLVAYLRLATHWDWRSFVLTGVLIGLWMGMREANSYIGLMVAFVLLVIGLPRKRLRIFWVHSLFILIVFTVNSHLSAAYGLPRWAMPLAEVITKRILPEPEYLAFFTENGMPVSPELMSFSGKWANSDNFAIINSQPLREFSKWLFTDAKLVYVEFLLTHPLYTIVCPLVHLDELLSADYTIIIPIQAYRPALPEQVTEVLYPQRWFWPAFWLSLILLGAAFLVNLRAHNAPLWVILLFLLLSIPHLYLVWHGDALDVERHAAMANVQFHVGIWLLAAGCLDLAARGRRSPARPA